MFAFLYNVHKDLGRATVDRVNQRCGCPVEPNGKAGKGLREGWSRGLSLLSTTAITQSRQQECTTRPSLQSAKGMNPLIRLETWRKPQKRDHTDSTLQWSPIQRAHTAKITTFFFSPHSSFFLAWFTLLYYFLCFPTRVSFLFQIFLRTGSAKLGAHAPMSMLHLSMLHLFSEGFWGNGPSNLLYHS